MDIQAFAKLTNEHGLVPMQITADFAPYFVGNVAGFPLDEALRLYTRQHALPLGKDGRPVPIPDDGRAANTNPSPASEPVAIPKNWDTLHHLSRIQLAKKIVPDEPTITARRADEIIRAELQRREEENSHAEQQNGSGNP